MAECLYYGDKPIGLVQSNAEDVEYAEGVSVKDKIDENIDLKTATSSTHQSASIRYIQTGRIVTVYGTYTPQTSSTEEIETTLPKPSAIFTVPFRTQSGNMGLIYFDNNGSLQQWNHTGTITAGQAVQFNFTYICI